MPNAAPAVLRSNHVEFNMFIDTHISYLFED